MTLSWKANIDKYEETEITFEKERLLHPKGDRHLTFSRPRYGSMSQRKFSHRCTYLSTSHCTTSLYTIYIWRNNEKQCQSHGHIIFDSSM